MLVLLILLLSQVLAVAANTEKAIFLGPSKLQVPIEHPTLETLRLDVLSPLHLSLRTHIKAEFPTDVSKYGRPTWLLLHGLREGQRYEVRICWAATVSKQPIPKKLTESSSNQHPSDSIPMSFLQYSRRLT